MKRAGLVGVVLIAAFVTTGGSAWAGPTLRLCVPKAAERPTLTPKRGKCKRGYKLTSLGAEGKAGAEGKQGAGGKAGPEGKPGLEGKAGFTTEQAEQLKALLPYVRFVGNGVAGKPTVQFSAVNVQIVNGEGKTRSTNGEGNLVIGYDEAPGEQTGSHNLVLGVVQTFTSYAGIDAGTHNGISAPFASVSGGAFDIAGGEAASVSGGFGNTASGETSSVSGGDENTASGIVSSVSGGAQNKAKGSASSIFGGHLLEATALYEAKP
jgi:hypothetical protein